MRIASLVPAAVLMSILCCMVLAAPLALPVPAMADDAAAEAATASAATGDAATTQADALAEAVEKPTALPDAPRDLQADRSTPVMVEHVGTDSVGARLVYRLKELFNRSSLFTLTAKDEKKIKVVVHSAEEFKDRPGVSSVYAVIWSYSESEGTLRYTLSSDVGVVNFMDLDGVAEMLANRTDGVSAKYAYLFE